MGGVYLKQNTPVSCAFGALWPGPRLLYLPKMAIDFTLSPRPFVDTKFGTVTLTSKM